MPKQNNLADRIKNAAATNILLQMYQVHSHEEVTNTLIAATGILAEYQTDDVEMYCFLQSFFLEMERASKQDPNPKADKRIADAFFNLLDFYTPKKINDLLADTFTTLVHDDEGLAEVLTWIRKFFVEVERSWDEM